MFDNQDKKKQILETLIEDKRLVYFMGSFYGSCKGSEDYKWERTNLFEYIYINYDTSVSKDIVGYLSEVLPRFKEVKGYDFPIRTSNGWDIVTENNKVVVKKTDNEFTPYNIPVEYQQLSEGKTVDSFMESVVSEASSADNLYEILGEPLIRGGKHSSKAHLIWGTQGTGKSTFVELFFELYGECATVVPFRNIQEGKRCHSLTYSLVNIDDDIDEKQYGDVKMIKQIVTRNKFSCDNLYHNTTLEIIPQFCNVFTCNELPEFSSKGEEMSIRFRVEKFANTFRGTSKCDTNMADSLGKELSYLLNKCIEGANRLLERDMKFDNTADSEGFAEEVKRQDTVTSFLEDYENIVEVNTMPQLFELYVNATKRDGKQPLSKYKFGKRMRTLGWDTNTSRDSNSNVYYHWYKK